MNQIFTATLDPTFFALAAFLEEARAASESFVFIGGSALLALGLVSRTTRDAEIMAGLDARCRLVDPRPMFGALKEIGHERIATRL